MREMKKRLVLLLIFAMTVGFLPTDTSQAVQKVKLSSKKISVTVGQTKTLQLKNNKKKVIWTVTSGKKNVMLKSKKKTSVKIKGRKAGSAKVQAKVGKKKYVCTVTVKKKAATNTPTNGNSANGNSSAGTAGSATPTQIPDITKSTETPSSSDIMENSAAGLYDLDMKLKYSWDKLLENGWIIVSDKNEITVSSSEKLEGVLVISPNVTSIGEWAFCECNKLTSIEIPSSVTNINYNSIDGCDALTSIIVSDDNPNYDSRGNCNAIIEKKSNTLICGCQSTKIPDSVTSIGVEAFSWCRNLTDIEIPDSVTNIGGSAFSGCSGLTSIEIPSSVTSIGVEAFFACSGLTSIIVSDDNPNYDSRKNCNAIIEKESNTLISGCQNTEIPDNVTSIGYGAFGGCGSLTHIKIPDSVISIDNDAFSSCESLTDIEIPDSVTSIGGSAFGSCNGLTSIKIPSSVTSMRNAVFDDCSNLTTIYCQAEERPSDWDSNWNVGCSAEVVWGTK